MSANAGHGNNYSDNTTPLVSSNIIPPHAGHDTRMRQTHSTNLSRGQTLPIVSTTSGMTVRALSPPNVPTWRPGATFQAGNFDSELGSFLLESAQRTTPPSTPPKIHRTPPKLTIRNPSTRRLSISPQNNPASSVAIPPGDVVPPLSDSPSHREIKTVTRYSPPSLPRTTPSSPLPDSFSNQTTSSTSPPQDDQTSAVSNPPYDAATTSRPGESSANGAVVASHVPGLSHSLPPQADISSFHPKSMSPWQNESPTPMMSGSTLNVTTISPNHTWQKPDVLAASEKPGRRWKYRWLFLTELRCRWLPWLPWWALLCIIAMILALCISIPLGFALRIKDFAVPVGDETQNSEVQLIANLVDIDPAKKIMTIDWEVVYAACNVDPCEDYDIFFDQNLLMSYADTTANDSNNLPNKPVFSINGTIFNGIDTRALSFSNLPFFSTKLFITNGAAKGKQGLATGQERTLQAYPFDHYLTEISISATFKGNSFNIDKAVGISIAQAQGVAAGFTTTLDPYSENDDNGVILRIDISRGIEVRLYSVVIVIAIWLITLALLSGTISAVIMGRRIAKEVMLIPVSTLFAFTQLRGSLPGAPPGFGAILDFVGVLPCLAILALCSVLQLAVFLFRNPEVDRNDKDSKIA